MYRRLCTILLAALACLAPARDAAPAAAPAPQIEILVLKEHGVGSPTLAQPYVDRFVALAARDNGWAAAQGHYLSNRDAAESFIAEHEPHYAILSLGAFLALRGAHRIEVIGRVGSALAGGEQYFIVSKSVSDLAGCRGKTLASDHLDDARFVENVIARGSFRLRDFELRKSQRPLQAIHQVLAGDVVCALIDDAQQQELAHLDASGEVRVVWQSRTLPPMAVVAFPSAPPDEVRRFEESLAGICNGDGRQICEAVGIRSLETASARDYAEVVSAYGR
ncbi:MAG TPA: PhnD/SsuA/transferrin family substrate-binding protein [Myxococcota bacterium]|nr:PhnD/SsuA/transferrin family substrate-binding protein [Myxococcota bacterium]